MVLKFLFVKITDIKVKVKDCYVTMGKIPGQAYNYSDHEGVAVVFTLQRGVDGKNTHNADLSHAKFSA